MGTRWFEKRSLADFDQDKSMLMTQLGATKWSSKIQFYRKVRDPLDTDDLLCNMKGTQLIWMNDDCFIMLRKLPWTVPHGSTFRKATTNIDFGPKSVYIYGKTDDIVMRAIILLLCLDDEGAHAVRIGSHYSRASDPAVPTAFLTSRFLSAYLEANPDRRLILGHGCYLSDEQSIALASHPEQLDVGLECVFEDGGRTFVQTLLQRTSDFGTLSLHNRAAKYRTFDVFRIVMTKIPNITLHMSSHIFKHSVHLPMSALAKRVEYKVWDYEGFDDIFDDIEPVTIVPKSFTVVFVHSIPVRFHTLFLQESRNLRELGMIYESDYPPSMAQRTELFQAITSNKNLYRLELGCLAILQDFWDEVLEVIGSHVSLRFVVFWVSDTPNLRLLGKLAAFLKNRFYLDVSFMYRDVCQCRINAIESIIEPVLFQNRAKSLTRASGCDRTSLFGAALTDWAGTDVSKMGLLLNENADLLCSLVGQPRRRGKRQRGLLSFPDFTKRKIAL